MPSTARRASTELAAEEAQERIAFSWNQDQLTDREDMFFKPGCFWWEDDWTYDYDIQSDDIFDSTS